MTVTLAGSVDVKTGDFRAALQAVIPHAGKSKAGDEITALGRVRLVIDAYHVNVMASNGATSALAQASIEQDDRPAPEHDDDGPFVIDLAPTFVDQAIKVFVPRRARKNEPDSVGRLELAFSTKTLDLTTAPGGVFDGLGMTFPIEAPNGNFPNLLELLGRSAREAAGEAAPGKSLVTGGPSLHLFEAARKAYKQELWVSGIGGPESPGWLVEVGDSFIGHLGGKVVGDDERKTHASRRGRWVKALPQALKAAS